MKTLTFAVLLLCSGALASAQQVSLLEDEAVGASTASAVNDDGMPQVTAPKDEAPAAAAPSTAAVIPAAATGKPVKTVINKKKKGAAVAISSPTVKSQPAAALAVSSAAPVKPVEAVKLAVKPASEVKHVEVVRSAVKPAKAVKPAAVKPAAKPAPKPAVVQAPPAVAGAGFSVGKTHTVTGGDTLWGLSGKYYKDPYKWGKIYNANLGTVANPDRIYPKEELVIPGLTEEVKPEAGKAPVIAGGETVKEAGFTSSDVRQAEEAPAPAAAGALAPAKTAQAELGAMLKEFDANDLSEEMPEHQKEWSAGVMIVPESWQDDGVVASAEGGEEQMTNSLSVAGDVILVTTPRRVGVKQGDYLSVYLKGATAYDKAGRKLGREIQRAGTLKVLSVKGEQVQAEVIEALTAIIKGYVVKKK